jgi:hypothetical protein
MRIICDGLLFSSAVIVLVVIANFLGIFVEKRSKSLDPFRSSMKCEKVVYGREVHYCLVKSTVAGHQVAKWDI